MPIKCPSGSKARYRYAKSGARLAFCDNKVVEVKKPGAKRVTKKSK